MIFDIKPEMTRVPDLGAAKAELTSYIADKNRYVSITEQQGPLRNGEPRINSHRRWYIKQKLHWDPERALWRNKDGRPLVKKDQIWDTVISEMRQLEYHGQKAVWTTVKTKFDGILEDDIRMICKGWYKHGLAQLDCDNESHWSLLRDHVQPAGPSDNHPPTARSQPDNYLPDKEPSQNDESSQDDNGPQGDGSPQDEESSRRIQRAEQDTEFILRFKTDAYNLPKTIEFTVRLRVMMMKHLPHVPPPNMILYAALKEAHRNGNPDARRTEPYRKWQLWKGHQLEEEDDVEEYDEDDDGEDDDSEGEDDEVEDYTDGDKEQKDEEEQEGESAEEAEEAEEEEEGSAAEGSIEL